MPNALGGAQLEGNRLVRITYVDESGTNPGEPFFVVAGVIVDGNKKLAPVEDHLEGLVAKHIPEPDQKGFVFHAADIWNARKYFKDENEWPWERREPILRDLVDTIPKFKLPVCVGLFDRFHKDSLRFKDSATPLDRTQISHSFALMNLAMQVEDTFRRLWPDEFTILVHEDRPEVREMLKAAILALRNFDKMDEYWRGMFPRQDILPLRKIRDTALFASKEDCRLLQLSDVCAYFARGTLSGNNRHWPYHDTIAPQMVAYPEDHLSHHDRAMKSAGLSSFFAPWE